MTDPIRAALDAAAKTYCHLEVKCTCKGPERCFNSAIPKAKTAEAIAAFLRALPINHSRVPFYAYWHPLARAVENAAKDQTND
jgi:hypothetical protein